MNGQVFGRRDGGGDDVVEGGHDGEGGHREDLRQVGAARKGRTGRLSLRICVPAVLWIGRFHLC